MDLYAALLVPIRNIFRNHLFFNISKCFSFKKLRLHQSRTFLGAAESMGSAHTDCLVAENESKDKFFSVSVQVNVFYVFVFSGMKRLLESVAILLMIEIAVLRIPLQNRILGLCGPSLPWHANTSTQNNKNQACDSFKRARTGGGTWPEKHIRKA